MLSEKIRNLADTIGIDAVGFTNASPFSDYKPAHSRRIDPKQSLPDAKTIIIAGIYIGGLSLDVWKNSNYCYSNVFKRNVLIALKNADLR